LKKTIVLLAILIIAGSSTSFSLVTSASTISDLESSYAKKEIEALLGAEIITGYEDETFKPKEKVSRAEFAKMLALALDLPENREAAEKFNDMPEWAAPYVGALVKEGLVKGISTDIFGSTLPIERQDIMVMLIRAMDLVDYSNFIPMFPEFLDENEIADYAFHKVAWAHYIDLTVGYKGKFMPTQPAQRQEAAIWIYKISINKEKYERKAMELAIERTFNPHVKKIMWLDSGKIEITFSTKEKKVYLVSDLIERVYLELQYGHLSNLVGEDWITFDEQKKMEFVNKMIDFWQTEYDFINVVGDDMELRKVLIPIINDHFNSDEEYVLYDEMSDIMVKYAVDHDFVKFKEFPDGFVLP
jgi:hypothetical protein